MLIKTMIKESNGASLKALIHKKENNEYIVEYFVNNVMSISKSFNNVSIYEIESNINNWFNSIILLNE
jgi:hypothetical protein